MSIIKKCIILLLAAAMLIPACTFAEEMTADSTDALQAHFQQCAQDGLNTFTISCSAELYETMKQDRYAQLDQLCKLSGIKSYELRTSSSGKLLFEEVVYGDVYLALCETMEEAKAAVTRFISQEAVEFELHCSAELFSTLFSQGRMYRLMTELGYEDFTMKGNMRNQIFMSELQKSALPYAVVSSVSEAGEKIAGWRGEGYDAFNLLFDEEVFASLTREDYRLIAFLGGLDNYSLSYNTNISMLLFSKAVYSDIPGAYCTSEEEVVDAIKAMGARGYTDFQFKMDQATYDALTANSFARLYELEAQAGMTDSQLSFSGVSRMLIFKNASISADVTVLSSLAEATAYVEAAAARGDADISMLLTSEVYEDLMSGVSSFFVTDAKFYDLIANAGILSADDISFNRHSGAINLRGVRYYAGMNILRAAESGDRSALTRREQEALDAATLLAESCRRDSDLETAKAIHDELCAMIVYTDDEATEEDDCCIGALLNGEANCDGYADALLLTGRLAGLNVRYQHGDSLNDLLGMFSTHMWNLIELDGTWRMIDATWADTENGIVYCWFNIGEDRASRSHVWSSAMTVPMLPQTDASSRPVAEFFAQDEAGVTAAARQAQADGLTEFDIYFPEGTTTGVIAARTAVSGGLSGSFYYTWIDSLKCIHIQLVP